MGRAKLGTMDAITEAEEDTSFVFTDEDAAIEYYEGDGVSLIVSKESYTISYGEKQTVISR